MPMLKIRRCNLRRAKSFAVHLPDNPCWLIPQIHLLWHVYRSWFSNLIAYHLTWQMIFSFKVRILIFPGVLLLITE